MKYQNILNNKIQCTICPRECILAPGQRGFCYVRSNSDGQINLDSYGLCTGLAIDPVEKKPLYHFYPESNVLSFGTLGCCMGCQLIIFLIKKGYNGKEHHIGHRACDANP